MKSREFIIDLSPDAMEHLHDLNSRERRILLDKMDRRLRREPTIENRNRKPLDPNDLASWELRVGDLRVFYDVDLEPEAVVWIRAIGRKVRDRFFIGGKEFPL